jgi:putative flippase GtrA
VTTEQARPVLLSSAGEFIRFGGVGAVGLMVSIAIVYAVRGLIGLYAGGLVAWAVAATVTWLLNRVWTFRERSTIPFHRQWVLFLGTSLIGFTLYYATYATLVTYSSICSKEPVAAVSAGAMAGMFVNFTLSRRLVFR